MEELPQRSWLVGCGRDCWWTAKASAVDSLYCGACHRWKQQLELQPAPYSFSFWCMRRVGFCAGRRRDRLAWRISLQGVSYKVIIYFFFIFFCRPNSPNSAYSFCVWSNASWRWDLSLNIVNSQRPACLHLSPPPLPISICSPFLQCPVAEKSQKNEKNGPGETNGIPSDSRRKNETARWNHNWERRRLNSGEINDREPVESYHLPLHPRQSESTACPFGRAQSSDDGKKNYFHFYFLFFISEVEEEDGGRDDQHEKEGRRRVENIAASKKKKREKGGWKWRHRCVAFVVVTGPSVLSLSSRPATRFLRRTNLSSSSSFASDAAQDEKN